MFKNLKADYDDSSKLGILIFAILITLMGYSYTKLSIEKKEMFQLGRPIKSIKIKNLKFTNPYHLMAILYTLTFGPFCLILGLVAFLVFLANMMSL